MNGYSTGKIRQELGALTASGHICHDTWQVWRQAAGLLPRQRKATYEQWVKLCAAFALSKQGKKVNSLTVKIFLRQNGDDPMAFVPGLLPIGAPERIPGFCRGRDLPNLFFDWLGVVRSEDTIARWCTQAGLAYSRGLVYSREQVLAIVHVYATAQRNKRMKALQNLNKIGIAA